MKRYKILLPLFIIMASILACVSPTSLVQKSILPTIAAEIPTQISNLPIQNLPSLNLGEKDAVQVALYEQVSPGVVSIQVSSTVGDGQGSGFVYDTNGYVITNYHVVEGATDIEVDFPSGFKTTGKVIGTDTDSDIAIVKVDAPESELHPLSLGNSNSVKVGQTVVAIGNPFGLNGTMTIGIISALGRTLDSLHDSGGGNVYTAGDIIQTDAAINPGNSGGPLLNLNGEVIGINRAIRTSGATVGGEPGNIGIGFAVPINIVKRVIPELIANGKYDYPYLGLSSLPDMSLSVQKSLGLSQSTGAYIVEVVPGGPAENAGVIAGTKPTDIQGLLAGGDLVVAIDGNKILTFADLLKYLINEKAPGDQVVLSVIRDNQQKEITLTLGSRP